MRTTTLAGLLSQPVAGARLGYWLAGAATLGAGAFVFRRQIFSGALFAAKGTVQLATAIPKMTLESIANAAANVPTFTGAAYKLLPPAPSEPKPETDLTELDPAVVDRFVALIGDINRILGPVGYMAQVSETYRTPLRQLWLWGIGRFYQAPGRVGPVTQHKTARGKHPQRKAVDLYYRPIGGGRSNDKIWFPALKAKARELEKKHGMRWGGFWKNPFDPPHWEIA